MSQLSTQVDHNANRILSKRKLQELLSQIDSAERLDPEIEDLLVDIAEDFVENVTTFACQLAKHRKSDTLEVKDMQLHLGTFVLARVILLSSKV